MDVVRPASRHKRASAACRLSANDRVEAVVRREPGSAPAAAAEERRLLPRPDFCIVAHGAVTPRLLLSGLVARKEKRRSMPRQVRRCRCSEPEASDSGQALGRELDLGGTGGAIVLGVRCLQPARLDGHELAQAGYRERGGAIVRRSGRRSTPMSPTPSRAARRRQKERDRADHGNPSTQDWAVGGACQRGRAYGTCAKP